MARGGKWEIVEENRYRSKSKLLKILNGCLDLDRNEVEGSHNEAPECVR